MANTTTMESAFQSLLEKVGELNLNEGDFLTMNNLLKESFNSQKSPKNDYKSIPVDLKLTFTGKKTLLIHICEKLDYHHDSAKFRYTINGTTKTPANLFNLSVIFGTIYNINTSTRLEVEYDGESYDVDTDQLVARLQDEDEEDENNLLVVFQEIFHLLNLSR